MRKRLIASDFWEDEKIGKLSHSARLLFIGLWARADDNGNFRVSLNPIKGSIFSFDEKVDNEQLNKWMQELSKQQLIKSYFIEEQQYGHLPNFKKHQRLSRRISSNIPLPKWQSPTKDSRVDRIWAHYLAIWNRESDLTELRRQVIMDRLKKYSEADLIQAITNSKKDKWPERINHSTLENNLLAKHEQVDKWLNFKDTDVPTHIRDDIAYEKKKKEEQNAHT